MPEVRQVLVVSRDPDVLAAAQALGAGAYREQAGSLNGALTEVAATLAPTEAMLVVPVDVPLIRPEDIRQLLAAAPTAERYLVVAPSHDGGTGALLVRPPGVVPFRFGTGSCAAHVAAASERGVEVRVVHNRHIAFDVDIDPSSHRRRCPP